MAGGSRKLRPPDETRVPTPLLLRRQTKALSGCLTTENVHQPGRLRPATHTTSPTDQSWETRHGLLRIMIRSWGSINCSCRRVAVSPCAANKLVPRGPDAPSAPASNIGATNAATKPDRAAGTASTSGRLGKPLEFRRMPSPRYQLPRELALRRRYLGPIRSLGSRTDPRRPQSEPYVREADRRAGIHSHHRGGFLAC
jgi:hypothetical protein